MTLKELSQLFWLNKEIEREKEKIERLKAKNNSPTSPNLSGMPGSSGDGNQIERYIEELEEKELKLAEHLKERDRLERFISDIPDSLTRQIFSLRFENEKRISWSIVAKKIGGNHNRDSVKKICYRYLHK